MPLPKDYSGQQWRPGAGALHTTAESQHVWAAEAAAGALAAMAAASSGLRRRGPAS